MSYASSRTKAGKRRKHKVEQRPTLYWYMFRLFRWMDWRHAALWLNRRQYPTHNVFINGRHAGVRTVGIGMRLQLTITDKKPQ